MKINKSLLKELCQIQTVSGNTDDMKYFIIEYLSAMGVNSYEDAAGNLYCNQHLKDVPCIVSHIDTVHDIVSDLSVYECNNRWTGINEDTMKATGIGGDDKVGIYIALHLLKTHDIKAAFFVDEETGCDGSLASDAEFFKDCLYILQCDRRGNKDFVTDISGPISSKKFQHDILYILNEYGYKFTSGMMTDVLALSQKNIGVSMANMSCGYYNPHQANEYIDLDDVENCLNMVNDLFYVVRERYPHKYKSTWNIEKHSGARTYGYREWWQDRDLIDKRKWSTDQATPSYANQDLIDWKL